MEINEYKTRINGVANLPVPLKLGHNYDLTIKSVECRKSSDDVNDDGTKDKVFVLKISELTEINIVGEEVITKITKT